MEKRTPYLAIVSIIFLVAISLTLFIIPVDENPAPAYRSKIAQLSDSHHWYYEIYKDNRLIIKQKYIPGVQGFQGFQTREDAYRVASVVVEKLENGDFPVVSKQELEELSITFKNQ